MTEYQVALKRLNKEQKRAVETIDGPVLVIAGPGTGKTELLGVRVAYILQTTDAHPTNILCLTFTNKAAHNMQERLTRLIGSDAQSITVRTFHSFAAEIMNRYPEYFFSGARLSIAPEATQLEIVSSVLDGLPSNHPLSLRFAGQYTLIKDVRDAINLTKDAGLSAKQLRTVINQNLNYLNEIEPQMSELASIRVSDKAISRFKEIVESLPTQKALGSAHIFRALDEIIADSFAAAEAEAERIGKRTPYSKWKSRWVQTVDGKPGMHDERTRNEWWLGVADAYELYEKEMRRRSYFDYADMLISVVRQLEARPELRAAVQEQFQYILIDEFQDTNPAQLRLAYLVADHPVHEGKPNILAVGDDDQSIYKFQGAELSNMLNFRQLYPSVTDIVLSDNYRSTQAVLDVAETIIEHAAYRLVREIPEIEKKLRAQRTRATSRIAHIPFPSQPEQYTALAESAATALHKGQTVAVLARSHASLRAMAALLHSRDVPIRYEQTNDIFEKPAVELATNILRLLAALQTGDNMYASQLLSEILPHPMWQLPPAELWRFALKQHNRKDWYGALLDSKEPAFQFVGTFLRELLATCSSQPVNYVLEALLGLRPLTTVTSPFKQYYIDKQELDQTYLETLSAVQLLRTVVSEFSHHQHAKLRDFVSFIDLMQNNQQILADNLLVQTGETYVALHTVHTAKGLEFDTVVVLDACTADWSPRSRGRVPPANIPLRRAEDDADDYARLMYVAATRAKDNLIIGSYQRNIKGAEVLASPLIDKLKVEQPTPAKLLPLIQTYESLLAWPRLDVKDERRLLQAGLENYSMSVTHLINFLDVTSGGPEYFLERNLLRLPSAKSTSLSFGTALHAALEEAQKLTNSQHFSLKRVQAGFERALFAESLNDKDFKKELSHGLRLLEQLLGKQGRLELLPGAKPEYKIENLPCGEARVNGQLDVLAVSDERVLIRDYKTGRALSSLQAKSGDAGIKAWRHKTQLIFYALLAQLDPHIPLKGPLVTEIVYVESPTIKDLTKTLQPSENEITRLATLVQRVWTKIMALDLPDISNYSQDLAGIQTFEEDLLA